MTTATMKEETTQPQAAKDKSAILALIDSMSKAHFDKNPHAIAANYAPDAAIYNLAPPLVHHGIDLEETQAWFGTWNGPIVIEPRDFRIAISGDQAVAWGYMRLAGNKIGVDHPVSFWMRETICLERKGDSWKIIHEHASVPFYMDGSDRPAFDLKP